MRVFETWMLSSVLAQLLLTEALFDLTRGAAEHRVSKRSGGEVSALLQTRREFNTSKKLQRADCNITKECHICPEDAIRDDADYCIATGWRQVRPLAFRTR